MGKQKVVIRVPMANAKKRSKALKTAAGFPDVISVGIEGDDKDQIVVVGEGIDSVCLTIMLRKQMGSAQLISVAPADEKKEEKEKKDDKQPVVYPYPVGLPPYPYSYEIHDPNYNQSCCII